MMHFSWTYYPERNMCIPAQGSGGLPHGLAVKTVCSLSTPLAPSLIKYDTSNLDSSVPLVHIHLSSASSIEQHVW